MSVYNYLETVAAAENIGTDVVTVIPSTDMGDAPIVNVWIVNKGANPLTAGYVESSMNGLTWVAESDPTGLDTLAAGGVVSKAYGPGINRYWRIRVKAADANRTSVEARIVKGNTVGPRITVPLILTAQDRAQMEPL